jgi:hypothetical protein
MNNFKIHTTLLLIFSLLLSATSYGQENKYIVPKTLNNSSWVDFKQITKNSLGVTYYLQTDTIPNLSIKVQSDTLSLIEVLTENLEPLGYNVSTDGYGSIFITDGIDIS